MIRRVATRVLGEVAASDHATAMERIQWLAREQSLRKRDRRFLTEIVLGVLRRRDTLDAVLGAFSRIPVAELQWRVLEALRVGVYQLLFLDGVPPFAAIHETVAAVKGDARTRAFVNAVLRTIDRGVRRVPLEKDRGEASPRKRLLVGERKVCFFPDVVFADPQEDLALHLAQVTSHPRWWVHRLLERLGEERTREILSRNNRTPRLFVRCQRLHGSAEDLLLALQKDGIRCQRGRHPDSVEVLAPVLDLLRSKPFERGDCTVQDETAMQVAPLVGARAGEVLLDVCAAPGGKATHLAELTEDRAQVFALDRDPERLERVRENARRLGLRSLAAFQLDPLATPALPPPLPQSFHRVLLDAPCSNSGVLGRRPEARYRMSIERLLSLVDVQQRLLHWCARVLVPGGRLVYSTCSIEPEENEGLVSTWLGGHPDFHRVSEETTLPHEHGDGGYAAVLERAP